MNKPKFTEGQWDFDGQDIGSGDYFVATTLTGGNEVFGETKQANGNLIAAAPELYEALRYYVKDALGDDCNVKAWFDQCHDDPRASQPIIKAIKAILKASPKSFDSPSSP